MSLTGTGQFLGTPDYSAPEQIQGQVVDGRADQYALACVAWQLLAGAAPFARDQGMAVLLAHLSAPRPSLGSRRPGLPATATAAFPVTETALSPANSAAGQTGAEPDAGPAAPPGDGERHATSPPRDDHPRVTVVGPGPGLGEKAPRVPAPATATAPSAADR